MMAMNEQAAQALINDWISELEKLSYKGLVSLVGHVQTRTRVGEDGNEYQLEAQVFWDSKKGGDIHVMVSADDGGLRAFFPLTSNFVIGADGYIAGG